MKPPLTVRRQKQPASFLFLAGHGLLTPLSALRWGAGRLKASDQGNLNDDQKDIIRHIEKNSAVLSRILNSMLLLSKLEDQVHTPKSQEIRMCDLLQKEAAEWKQLQSIAVDLECDTDLVVTGDPMLLTNIVKNLLSVFNEENMTGKSITVSCVREKNGDTVIAFSGSMDVPFLQYVQTIQLEDNIRSVVGGTAGLFLAVSQGMLEHIGGTLDMWEEDENKTYVVEAKVRTTS